MTLSRRDLMWGAALSAAAPPVALPQIRPQDEWIKTARILNVEAYNPPFYPEYTYDPERAVRIARDLNANTFRYPAASYYAYFPTRTLYPVHPELKGDPLRETMRLCRKAGLKTLAYVPLNHPFMNVAETNPELQKRYRGWMRYDAEGRPISTNHYGWTRFYEGCLNSPLRNEIFALVREVLAYDFDGLYFDGPYEGMQNRAHFCHCRYCVEAYRKARGREIPADHGKDKDALITYTEWMAKDVCIGTLRELVAAIKKARGIPVLFNDTSLLSQREWRARAFPVTDGFMFEAADTPEQKLFNLQLGRSTGKTIWTYVGHHTQYNREHLKDTSVRGWYSYPLDGEELSMDGSTAVAAGVGMVFWSLARFYSMPKPALSYTEGRRVREIFDLAARVEDMTRHAHTQPQAGVLVGAQTLDWYEGKVFVGRAYPNGFRGAWRVMKELSIESEPFLDFTLTPEQLRRYRLIWAPNAVCLSDAQCGHLMEFVERGGTLIATLLTGFRDEYGRPRVAPTLQDFFGIWLSASEPVEIPDLYLQRSGRDEMIPQDPQVIRFEPRGAEVLATTLDLGHAQTFGPAITRYKRGQGEVLYIGSSLDAIYEETRMPSVLELLASLLEPRLGRSRWYRVEPRAGLMPHFLASPDALYLHLLADTGDKVKKSRARESYLPLRDVKVEIRLPAGRAAKSISLLRAETSVPFTAKDGWIRLTVPEVSIHEAVHIKLV